MNNSIHDQQGYYYADERERHSASAESDKPAAMPGLEIATRLVDQAIKYLVLLTGGATIALLAFAGNALNGPAPLARLEPMASAIGWCAYAAVAAVLVPALAYLAQRVVRELEEPAASLAYLSLRALAVLCWFGSLGCFMQGMGDVSAALTANVATAEHRSWLPTVSTDKALADRVLELEKKAQSLAKSSETTGTVKPAPAKSSK